MRSEQKNIIEIKNHLDSDEFIVSHIAGAYECKILGKDTVRNGIIAVTNKRMVFFGKKLTGYDLEIFPFRNISSFATGKGLMGHNISFYATGNSVKIKWINSKNVNEFIVILKDKLENETNKDNTKDTKQDVFEKLKEIKELFNIGILSADEYEDKKKYFMDIL